MKNMKRTICLKGTLASYTLERKRVKNVNLRVRGGEIFVSAPRWVPLAVIEGLLDERADYILGALARTEKTVPSSLKEGASIPFCGSSLSLELCYAPKTSVTAEAGILRIALRAPEDEARVRQALEKWYRTESERLCRASFERLWPHFAALGVPYPEIRMRAMRSCWGNCRPAKRVVTFNSRLAAVPEDCIEYVVAHELTHFLHADHSPSFYRSLAGVIPDWKARRRSLRPYAAFLKD